MSALLDNVINGNRGDARELLRKKTKKDAMLAVVDLIEDLLDANPDVTHDGFAITSTLDNVRSLVEAM
jgi:hypothetical protein